MSQGHRDTEAQIEVNHAGRRADDLTGLNQVTEQIIGCCIRVHRELGPGLLEGIYQRAMEIELVDARISFEREYPITVKYKGHTLCLQRLDFVVEGNVVVELKAVDRLGPIHQAQILSYLRASRLRLGLLVNFNSPVLRAGLKRVVL